MFPSKEMNRLKSFLKTSPLGRWVLMIPRYRFANAYFKSKRRMIGPWLKSSHELVNLTYSLSPENQRYAAQYLSLITGRPASEAAGYIQELLNDPEIPAHVARQVAQSSERFVSDEEVRYGRRVLYYALARLIKPKVIVEAGVDKGLAMVCFSRALARNAEEGFPGKVIGIDIESKAGYLVKPPFDAHSEFVLSDSVEAVRAITEPIDIFIHETIVSHESEHARLLETRLSEYGFIFSAWNTGAFREFAERTGRNYLVFAEELKDHWYQGGHLATVFRLPVRQTDSDLANVATQRAPESSLSS